jgi:hypothetical protein
MTEPEAWWVQVRYREAEPRPVAERLGYANWIEQVLRAEDTAATPLARVVPGGLAVAVLVRAATAEQAATWAQDLVEQVVGDSARVLGELYSTSVRRALPDR